MTWHSSPDGDDPKQDKHSRGLIAGMKRIVVTGMGMVTPLGVGHDLNWRRLVAGESGVRRIESFDVSDLSTKIAGQLPVDPTVEGYFDPDAFLAAKERRKIGDFILFAVAAASEALADAGWHPTDEEELERTGVMIGSGIGGLPNMYGGSVTLHDKGPRKVTPFFIPSCLINLASGYVSILHGFKGPNHSVVTACSSGAHAIGDAARLIQSDDADVMLAGGSEGAVCRIGIAGFAAARALSTNFNETPHQASRPYDRDRDGFVMGDGAGVVILEALEHAKARGARIYAEVIGYGLSGDAYHITSPPPDGNGGYRSMRSALRHAGLAPDDVDYINAHGTSTPLGDEVEITAIKRLWGSAVDKISVSSTKSSTGHMLGAAGAAEAIYCIKAIQHGLLPPTLNLEHPSDSCEGIDLVPRHAREHKVRVAMSNSFGFGGTNATLLFREWDGSIAD